MSYFLSILFSCQNCQLFEGGVTHLKLLIVIVLSEYTNGSQSSTVQPVSCKCRESLQTRNIRLCECYNLYFKVPISLKYLNRKVWVVSSSSKNDSFVCSKKDCSI